MTGLEICRINKTLILYFLSGLAEKNCPSIGMFSQITIKESFKTQQLIMEEATETGASKNYPLRGKKKKDILQVVLPVL